MSIDWNAFTPVPALIGGALIGAAAALFVVLNGRIAGVSGILGGLLRPAAGDVGWRIAFVAGLVAAPIAYAEFAPRPEIRVDAGYAMLIVAGLLVGVGTRYGAGCTSGHGVCGISRLSPRSIVATLAFMAAGFATVFVARHLTGA
ncbi:MAG: YeeE/YedE family protein [Burkholderiales bacterium]|nr:YeeE/YedE family protein [Burkholderiales bacterium]